MLFCLAMVLMCGITAAAVALTLTHLTRTVQKDARMAGQPIPVEAVEAKIQPIHVTVGASGMVEPSLTVTLSAAVMSKVTKVAVDLGTVVRPGDLLVQLDKRLFRANLEEARANHEYARKQLDREEALFRRRFAADVDVEKARSFEATTRQEVVKAELDLEGTEVRSPVGGVVLKRQTNPGELTRVGQDLLEIAVLRPVMMVAQISEDRIRDVHPGMKADVGTDAFPGLGLSGTVSKIDYRINPATRTFAAYIQLDANDLELKKGVTGYSRLQTTRLGLTVPETAVINPLGDKPAVFLLDKDGTVHLRAVRLGSSSDGKVEIVDGLDQGQRVVAAGQFDLQDKDRVTVGEGLPWKNKQEQQVRSASR